MIIVSFPTLCYCLYTVRFVTVYATKVFVENWGPQLIFLWNILDKDNGFMMKILVFAFNHNIFNYFDIIMNVLD